MGQKIVSVMVAALALFVALQPSMASSHRKKLHGHLRNHATTHARIRTLRKLSPLSSLSNASIASEQHELDAHSMEVDAREDNMQWTPDATNQSQSLRRGIHGELSASRQSSSINGELGKSAADAASRKIQRAASINGDLGRNVDLDAASPSKRNAIIHDQRNIMEAAELSIPITTIKDEIALDLKEKEILKSFNSSHAK